MKTRAAQLALIVTVLLFGRPALPQPTALAPARASELEYRLENLANELELLVRNHRADEADVKRQEHQLAVARAYQRIPFEDGLPALLKELRAASAPRGIAIERVLLVGRSGASRRIPRELYSDQTAFKMRPEDAVETLDIRIVTSSGPGAGDAAAVDRWAQGLGRRTTRLLDPPDGQDALRCFPDGRGHRTVDARIYRFRRIRFPRVRPRDPLSLLPASARRDPSGFARAEPRLWQYVERIRRLEPVAGALYPIRGRFFLNDARMSFLLSKLNIDPSLPD